MEGWEFVELATYISCAKLLLLGNHSQEWVSSFLCELYYLYGACVKLLENLDIIDVGEGVKNFKVFSFIKQCGKRFFRLVS